MSARWRWGIVLGVVVVTTGACEEFPCGRYDPPAPLLGESGSFTLDEILRHEPGLAIRFADAEELSVDVDQEGDEVTFTYREGDDVVQETWRVARRQLEFYP